MKKPEANTQQEKTEIEQLSQAELVDLVLGLQKIKRIKGSSLHSMLICTQIDS